MKTDFIVYSVNKEACCKFFTQYPKFKEFMLKYPINNKVGILKSFSNFIKEKNKLSINDLKSMWFESHVIASPTFGTKEFIDENWFDVKGHYAEIYQYLHKH